MFEQSHTVNLSDHDLKMIKEALFTQEKILSVQSRAGGNAAKQRLNELQSLSHKLQEYGAPEEKPQSSLWGQFARALYG